MFTFFKKDKEKPTESPFATFLLHASPEKKKRVFSDAAQRANKDQQETLKRSNFANKTN